MKKLRQYFEECSQRFDEDKGMLAQSFQSSGYHTTFPTGAWVHPTVPNLEYAVLLLRHGPQALSARAFRILDQVLPLQDVDPVSISCGIFPYLLEEPVSEMRPPDGNWALFCGARIAEALEAGKEVLPRDLLARMKTSLLHSGMFAYRNNILAGYSNIAVMGAGVAGMAGEMLSIDPLLQYARRRLQSVVQSIEYHGGLCEYNSVPYNLIVIHECERILFLLKDNVMRKLAGLVLASGWDMLSRIYHPDLGVFSGPQSRAYADYPDELTVDKLSERLGFPLLCQTTSAHTLWTGPIDLTLIPVPCPQEIRKRFQVLPEPTYQRKTSFILRQQADMSTFGTTWFSKDVTLGSVSRENFFYQRRPVLGYWKSQSGAAVALKVEFLCNGRPFTSAYSMNAQEMGFVLSGAAMIRNLGYHTPFMDIPDEGIFKVRSLRFRYVLEGPEVHPRRSEHGSFVLEAGGWRAEIFPVSAKLGDLAGTWGCLMEEGSAMVEAVLYDGEEINVAMKNVRDVEIAAGMALLRTGETFRGSLPTIRGSTTEVTEFAWQTGFCELQLAVPRRAVNYLWATGLEHR